jgi:lysophospholipase L1-like esterase
MLQWFILFKWRNKIDMKKIFTLFVVLSLMSIYAQNLIVFDGKDKTSGSGWGNPKNSVTLGVTDDIQFEGASTLQLKVTCNNWWGGGGWNWKNWAKEGDDISSKDFISFWIKKSAGELRDVRLQLLDDDNKTSVPVRPVKLGYISAIGDEFTKVVIPLSEFTGEFNKQRVACLNMFIDPITANGSATLNVAKIEFGNGDVSKPAKSAVKQVATKVTGNPAAIPTKSPADWKKWKIIDHKNRAKQGNINVLFIGDSITALWNKKDVGLDVWNEYFEPLGAAQFGVSGDKTQEILWRLSEGGELENVNPQVIVYLGGVNNIFSGETSDNVVGGIKATLDYLQKRLPESKIILLGLLPTGFTPGNNIQVKNDAVNKKISKFADNKNIFYLDLGSNFLNADKSLKKEAFNADGVHPCTQGYEIFATNLKPKVEKLLAATPKTKAKVSDLVIFNGKGKPCNGWADPTGSTFKISDSVKYNGNKTLELHGKWAGWWSGGGINWCNYSKSGNDLSQYTYLTFMVKKDLDNIHDLWIALSDTDNKLSGQVKIVDSGSVADINNDFSKVSILLSKFTGNFNKKSVSGLSYGFVPKTESGEGTIYLADIIFNSDPAPVVEDLALPEGVSSPWAMNKAWKQSSDTRESICLNGLWKFMPALDDNAKENPPAKGKGWGWFKVPGIWPCAKTKAQKILLPAFYNPRKVAAMDTAWYKRTIKVPANWNGRKISIDFDMLQTRAQVFVDGKEAGEVWFPGGQVDITDEIDLGEEQDISILVTAKPLSAESNAFMASDRIVTTKSTVALKGITGDVYLISEPKNNTVQDVRVETSTRKENVTFDIGISDATVKTISVDAVISKAGEKVREFTFDPTNVTFKDGRISVTSDWKDAELWDVDTPENMYEAVLTLKDANTKTVLDQTLPIKFGFREFWIDGRNFYLNGSIVHLRALHGNGLAGADEGSKAGALKTLKRLREYGFNSFIGGNYACKPGDVGYMKGTLEAADESGTLNSFTLPHVSYFKRKLDQPAVAEQYRKLTNYLIRKVQNHPSVILYVLNHNSMGYCGDQNNQKIDGNWKPSEKDIPSNSYFYKARLQGQISEDIAISIDPSRPIYHHASGNFSQMHTINIYLNWAPRQERSDWLEHWATKGTKPVFFVEWGMPHVASWSSYRGPEFIWTSLGMHKIWDSEFTAPFNGDSAYEMVPEKIDLLNQEMTLWEKGKPFGYWEIVTYIQKLKHNYNDIQAWFMADNLRSHRTWGISAFLPWDQVDLWRRVKETKTTTNPEKYKNLNQPGIVTDVFTSQRDYTEDTVEGSFEPTSTGLAMQRWNMPLLAYIAGAPTFTDKTHNYQAGKIVSKQLAIVNDTRRPANCKYSWEVLGTDIAKSGTITTKPGEENFVPVSFKMPASPAGVIEANFDFGDGKVYQDKFEINLLVINKPSVQSKIALYDPKGLSVKLFKDAQIPVTLINSLEDAENYDVLVIGREAFDKSFKTILDMQSFKKFAKILILEQNYKTLTDRFGFRATTLGIREMAVRTPNHPVLKGLSKGTLSNWRGESTLVEPHMDLPNYEMDNPKVNWCGFENSRVWRCKNRNSVASVIIEKPPKGNWLPLLDCGFDMQYSPLLEYTDSKSRIIFCQVDLSGRTANEPAAEILINNLISYLEESRAPDFRTVYYDGDKRGEDLLTKLGVKFKNLENVANLPVDSLLVLGPSSKSKNIQSKIEAGCNVIALGLNTAELNALLPGEIESEEKETVSYVDNALNGKSALLGISNAELHWREFPKIAALKPSAESENPALRVVKYGKGTVVLSQAAPWTFDEKAKPYVRTTYRRNAFLTARLLANAGAELNSPLRSFFTRPATLVKQDISANWKVADEKTLTNPVDNCWKPEFDDSSWKTVSIPNNYGDLGYTWYRLKFKVAKGFPENVIMSLGACDDESWIWLNGKFLGEITKENAPKDYYRRARDYKLPVELINSDKENVVVVRVNNTYLDGGMRGVPVLKTKGLWLKSYYIQTPIADDDPYRYYRW